MLPIKADETEFLSVLFQDMDLIKFLITNFQVYYPCMLGMFLQVFDRAAILNCKIMHKATLARSTNTMDLLAIILIRAEISPSDVTVQAPQFISSCNFGF